MTKQPGAKEYFDQNVAEEIKAQLSPYIYENILNLMEGYAASKPYSPEVARRLLKMRESVRYSGKGVLREIVTEEFDNHFWAEMERIAKGE